MVAEIVSAESAESEHGIADRFGAFIIPSIDFDRPSDGRPVVAGRSWRCMKWPDRP